MKLKLKQNIKLVYAGSSRVILYIDGSFSYCRVSFGGEKQFIVYDEPLLEDSPAVNHVTKYNSPFTP